MDVLSKAGTRWSAMARPGIDFAALERAQLLGRDLQAPRPWAAERVRATGDRTGELPGLAGRICRHTYRPRWADNAG
jgi:hypothetical protein